MKLAISAVQKNQMCLRQAAAAYSVAKHSLKRGIKGKLKSLSEEEIHNQILFYKYCFYIESNIVFIIMEEEFLTISRI